MKKIIIIGATYADNFGDMLFTKMMADALYEKNEIKFYLLSDYAKNFVGAEKISNFKNDDADALIYMPGGFFGDRHDTSLLTTWRWFVRYFPLGLKFARQGRPIFVSGVGAGPCKYGVMKKIIRYICTKSKKIIVREKDSYDFLQSLGIESFVASDLAQLITEYELPSADVAMGSKKKLLVHVNQNPNVASKVLPAVKRFYEQHKDTFSIVVASDQICPEDYKIYEQICDFAGEDTAFYKYGDPLELCDVIRRCDVVLTYKLHVGVVACAYGKSVIAVPEHYKKVERYYKHIGYPERVLPFYLADSDSIYNLIEQHYDTPVSIPENVISAAKTVYSELEKFVEEL